MLQNHLVTQQCSIPTYLLKVSSHLPKTFPGESSGGNLPGGNLSGGNLPGGNSPGGNSLGGNSPGGNLLRGISPGGNFPGGNSPDTENIYIYIYNNYSLVN